MLSRTKLVTLLALASVALASPALAQSRTSVRHDRMIERQAPMNHQYGPPDSLPHNWQGGETESAPPAGD